MMYKHFLPILSVCMLFIYTNSVYAHARLKLDSATPPRYTSDDIKTDIEAIPCGNVPTNNSVITGRISIFQVNETITVKWEETVDHDGYYVLEFAPANDQGFNDQVNLIATFNNDLGGATRNKPNNYQETITLPDQACTTCTLRMRQFMSDRGTNYLSCADIVLVSGNDNTPPTMAINLSATSDSDGAVTLNWENPTESDFKAVVVSRNTVSNNDNVNNRKHYLIDDTVGTSTVIYRGVGSSFADSGLAADTMYYYKIFTYDADYNYSAAATISADTTGTVSPPVDPPVDPPSNGSGGDQNGSNDDGGGSLYFIPLALLVLIGVRRTKLKVRV